MNNETKNEVKKNVATGASTAAGTTAGVFIGAALSPEKTDAQDIDAPKPTVTTATGQKPTHKPEPSKTEPAKQEPPKDDNTSHTENPTDEVEVISYDRLTAEDGSQADLAVINVNGEEVGIMDYDLDGKADVIFCDANHNGEIEEGEAQFFQGNGMAMQPLADAAGFNPRFAQNDIPDYVNDADVDSYMA